MSQSQNSDQLRGPSHLPPYPHRSSHPAIGPFPPTSPAHRVKGAPGVAWPCPGALPGVFQGFTLAFLLKSPFALQHSLGLPVLYPKDLAQPFLILLSPSVGIYLPHHEVGQVCFTQMLRAQPCAWHQVGAQ